MVKEEKKKQKEKMKKEIPYLIFKIYINKRLKIKKKYLSRFLHIR